MSHVKDHCKLPAVWRRKHRNRSWICDCGKTWMLRKNFDWEGDAYWSWVLADPPSEPRGVSEPPPSPTPQDLRRSCGEHPRYVVDFDDVSEKFVIKDFGGPIISIASTPFPDQARLIVDALNNTVAQKPE